MYSGTGNGARLSPFHMAQALDSVPRSHTEAYGKWLADQQLHFDEDGEMAWILNTDNRYVAEGVFEDSEERLLPNPEMKELMRLMQHAPALLRAVLGSLALLDDGSLNDTRRNERIQALLSEVAGSCLRGQGDPLDVARAVADRQASRE